MSQSKTCRRGRDLQALKHCFVLLITFSGRAFSLSAYLSVTPPSPLQTLSGSSPVLSPSCTHRTLCWHTPSPALSFVAFGCCVRVLGCGSRVQQCGVGALVSLSFAAALMKWGVEVKLVKSGSIKGHQPVTIKVCRLVNTACVSL